MALLALSIDNITSISGVGLIEVADKGASGFFHVPCLVRRGGEGQQCMIVVKWFKHKPLSVFLI